MRIITPRLKKAGSERTRALRHALEKARDTPQLATGLQWFLLKVVANSDLVKQKRDRSLVKEFCNKMSLALGTHSALDEDT